MEFIVLNCGKACGSEGALRAAMGAATAAAPAWSLLFLPEVDAFCDQRPPRPSSHLSYRHWPGEGSFAMQLCVRAPFQHLVQSVVWRNRCGAVRLYQRSSSASAGVNILIIVVHNAHGDLQNDVFLDMTVLISRRPRSAKVCVIGDWNIDQFPALHNDPWASRTSRMSHHATQHNDWMIFVTV